MNKPQNPPSFKQLYQELAQNPERMQRVFAHLSPIWKNRYLHWHTLQYHQGPQGLTSREWWTAIKIARLGQLRQMPLKDMQGDSFKFGMPDPVLEYLNKIDQNAGGQIQTLDTEVINTGDQEKYLVHSLIEEAITSSQLEGATSTRQVAKEMIRSERAPKNKSERMILNNYHTMRLIKEKTKENLSIDLILDLHRRLSENTMDDPDTVGRFRNAAEEIRVYDNLAMGEIVLHNPPPAQELKERTQALCDFANGIIPSFYIHPVIRSILLHFWLAYDHPFVDGNGRCARALFYWSMLRQGYWLCEYVSISQILRKAPSQYARSFLYSESDDNDLTYFLLYNLSILVRAIDELHSYIAARSSEISKIDRLLRTTKFNLNHRQIDLIQHALRHATAVYTIKGHQKANNIVYQTARTDLLGLERIKLLVKKQRGRETVFFPSDFLESKIKDGIPPKK
ncbi:MAG: Fic family protein [Chitinivibrionales bacterium]|nr:Fic family protein [Chitinivibrionales bacterium]